ncbi:signal peptidase I [Jeotgalibacillus malaysiensis]|uniref:signal peptidase I n=1 Tax=Jeotgalibacillus malaysiensis TaxID=1508404 RepID=UPI00384FEF1F
MSEYKREIDKMIGDEPRFTEELADRVISRSGRRTTRHTRRIRMGLAAAILLIGVSGITIAMLSDPAGELTQTDPPSIQTEEMMTDPDTPEDIPLIEPTETSLLLEWGLDSMDRGDHHYMTSFHNRLLVVETNGYHLTRGTVVYFETPASILVQNDLAGPDQIARIVGLPGETVEIRDGKVYIDDKRLDTFYGEVHRTGMTHEELLAIDREDNSNDYSTEDWYEFFSTDMPPVTVDDDSLFLLADNWGRGYDSRDFGLLKHGGVTGVVMGYEE